MIKVFLVIMTMSGAVEAKDGWQQREQPDLETCMRRAKFFNETAMEGRMALCYSVKMDD